MFLFTNKEKLKRSMIVNERDFKRVRLQNWINGLVLAFIGIGSIIMYFGFTDEVSKTQDMSYILIILNVFACIIILDHILEIKFLKRLLHEQSVENIFDANEWENIQKAAQAQRVSDKSIENSMNQ